MIIGKRRKSLGSWSYGIELYGTSHLRSGWVPTIEVFCFKILSFPRLGSAFDKKENIKGFWWIVWWSPQLVVKRTTLLRARGFRPRTITYPVKLSGTFHVW